VLPDLVTSGSFRGVAVGFAELPMTFRRSAWWSPKIPAATAVIPVWGEREGATGGRRQNPGPSPAAEHPATQVHAHECFTGTHRRTWAASEALASYPASQRDRR